MIFRKQVCSFLFTISCLFFSKDVVEGAVSGELSREMCKKYSKNVPDSYQCPFLNQSLVAGSGFAAPEEFPHMVMLGFKKQDEDQIHWSCSASLISDRYVLVSANCLNVGKPIIARMGVINLKDTDHLQEIKIAELIPHPDYHTPAGYNDIGLVKLEKKVDISTYTRPACLFTESEVDENLAINSGWGSLGFGEEFYDRLQKVVLEIYDQKSCNNTYHRAQNKIKNGINYDTMICAGTKSIVTYQPETGGPLLIRHKDNGKSTCMYDIVGVAAFGKPGVTRNVPSVYTKVSAFIKWIEDTIWK